LESCGSTSSVISVREALTGRPGSGFPVKVFSCFEVEVCFMDRLALPQKFGVPSRREYTMRMTTTQPQKKTRRKILEDFVAAKPTDAFARYGLAMECANSGDAAGADEHFKALLASHADYVAGYFQYGQFLAKAGRTEEARSALNAGIATAVRTGDQHARSEMETALADLA
jgi:hypothetical protein